jgi:MraZ protein
MALFLSNMTNKLDKKGRISVPSGFRSAMKEEEFQGVVLFQSNHHQCLEGFAWSRMKEINNRLDHFDMFSDTQDDMAMAIFGSAVQLPFDGDGRIILPPDLIDFAKLDGHAVFVGLGNKFQIWNSSNFEKRIESARKKIQSEKTTLPKEGERS